MDPTQTAFTLDPAQTAFTLDPTQTALTLDPESTMDRTHSGPWIHHTLHPVRILNPPWVHPTLHPAWALDPAYLQVPELDQVGQRVPGQGLRLLQAEAAPGVGARVGPAARGGRYSGLVRLG